MLRTQLAVPDDNGVAFVRLTIHFRGLLRMRTDYRRMHRICTEMRPLFELLRVHRNRQQHQRSEAPTAAQVRSLASSILHLLDLAPQELRCRRAWTRVERAARTAIGATGEDPGPLGLEIARLRTQNLLLGRRNRNLEKLATKATISIGDIQELIASRHEATVIRIIESLEEESERIRSDVEARATRSEAQSDELLSRLAELRRDRSSSGGAEPPPEPPEPPPNGSPLAMEAAERKLRALRDQIRRENPAVKPWENICMLRPIVEQAVREAAAGRLGTIEQWKRLPAVRQKFRDSVAVGTRDAQIAKHGDRMMAILRRVERTEGAAP